MKKRKFNPFPVLKTNRLILRRLSINDEKEIFLLRSDENINKFLNRKPCTELSEARQFIEKINEGINKDENIYWAVEPKDKPGLIGTICLWNFSEDEKKAEIGFELLPAYQRKGIMLEAAAAVIDYGFTKLNLDLIEGEVEPANIRSLNLMKKLNFILREETNSPGAETVMYELKKEIFWK